MQRVRRIYWVNQINMPSDTHNILQIPPQSIYSNEQTLPRPLPLRSLPLLVAWGVGEFLFVYFWKPFMNVRVRVYWEYTQSFGRTSTNVLVGCQENFVHQRIPYIDRLRNLENTSEAVDLYLNKLTYSGYLSEPLSMTSFWWEVKP